MTLRFLELWQESYRKYPLTTVLAALEHALLLGIAVGTVVAYLFVPPPEQLVVLRTAVGLGMAFGIWYVAIRSTVFDWLVE